MQEDRDKQQRVIEANIALHTALSADYGTSEPHFRQENVRLVTHVLKGLCQRTSAQKLLDLGCGTGFIIGIAKALVKEIHGVDVTQAMLDKVDTSGPAKVTLSRHEVGAYPVKEDYYDVVTAYAFLHHLYDVRPTLQTAYKGLRSGGIFYADLDPNFYFLNALKALDGRGKYHPIVERERKKMEYTADGYETEAGITPELFEQAEYSQAVLGGFKPEDLEKQLKEVGFRSVEIEPHWFIGEGTLINDQKLDLERRFQNARVISEWLLQAMPLSRNLFKYLRVVATK